ncbi:hypothetical protein HKD37_12G034111 [Glycine soja]
MNKHCLPLSANIWIMASPPASPPPPPSPPPPSDASASPCAVKRTRKASRLRSLSTRPPGADKPVVQIDPTTDKADNPHRKKLRTYLGIVARDKVDVMYENWKEAEFEILEASDNRTKKKLLQTIGERSRQFKSDLTRKWALAADQDGVDDTVCEKYDISKEKWAQFCQTRRDPSWEKLLAEKTKKKLEEATQSGSVDGVIDPPSPVRRHVKWKMARTKKTWEMTTEAAKEIAEKIDSFEEQATQGSFVPHGRQMFSPLLLDIQSTLDVSVLLEPMSLSSSCVSGKTTSKAPSGGLDDAPQPKSKAPMLGGLPSRYYNRQKGSTECGYYVMHWMSTVILGSFRNNWEAYFNDPRPLEPERLKALRIQWAQYYLRVRDQT